MAATEAAALHAELVRKWIKEPLATPLAKDFARLAPVTRVRVGGGGGGADGDAGGGGDADGGGGAGLVAGARVVGALAAALGGDGEGVRGRAVEAWEGVAGGAEKDAVAAFFTDAVAGGELDERVVRVLGTVNQGFVAPVSVELKLRLGMEYITADVRGSWSVDIFVDPDAGKVTVTHSKAEIGVSVPLSLAWSLAVDLAWSAEPVPDTLLASRLSIDSLDVAGLSHPQLVHISDALSPFLGPDALVALQLAVAAADPAASADGHPSCVVTLIGRSLTALPPALLDSPTAPGDVTALHLALNNLTTLPAELAPFSRLATLTLTSNALTAVPDVVFDLASLTSLHLGSNAIAAIPDDVARLTALTDLSLSYNQLTALPIALASLPALATLHVSNNLLPYIPTDLQLIANLQTLTIHNNPGYPRHLAGSSVAEIIDFLRSSG